MSTLDEGTAEKRVEAKLGFYNHVSVSAPTKFAVVAPGAPPELPEPKPVPAGAKAGIE